MLGLVALVHLTTQVWPLGPDYTWSYRPVTQHALHGGDPYEATRFEFYNAPWTLLLLVPYALLPIYEGQAALTLTSVLILVTGTRLLREEQRLPLLGLVLALANLHTFDLLIRGQIDAFPLLGVMLGWWAIRRERPLWLGLALLLMSIKPVNLSLVGALYLAAIRDWPRRDWLRVLGLPLVAVLVSGVIFGFDWPLRYLEHLRALPPNDYLSITVWDGAGKLGFPLWPCVVLAALAVGAWGVVVWRVGLDCWTLSIALATCLTFTTYANGNHYVLLVPVVIWVAMADWRLALLAYLATWTPLVRLWGGFAWSDLDIVYPVMLLVATWGYGWQEFRSQVWRVNYGRNYEKPRRSSREHLRTSSSRSEFRPPR